MNWKLICPFKGNVCWEMQVGPLIIQWCPESDSIWMTGASVGGRVWFWIDRKI